MSVKDKFEHHPVVFGLTLLAGGFIAGFTSRGWFVDSGVTPGPAAEQRNLEEVGSTVAAQIAALRQAHDSRVGALTAQLVLAEKEATDLGHIDVNQEVYARSAQRLRADIHEENEAFSAQLDNLMKIVGTTREDQ